MSSIKFNLAAMLLVSGLIQVSPAPAQQSNIPWSSFSTGNGQPASGPYRVSSLAGENAVGRISAGNLVIESGFYPGFWYANGINSALGLSLSTGWNMVSIPFLVQDYRKTDLFPTATTRAYTYDGNVGSYRTYDTLQTGTGYWLKFASPANAIISGMTFRRDTTSVTDKWNMVATASLPVIASNVVPLDTVSLITNFYGYFNSPSPGYRVVDTLEPGKAYWVKVHNPGRIILAPGANVPNGTAPSTARKGFLATSSASEILGNMSILTIRDSAGQTGTLYFSTTQADIDTNKWEIPPPLPFEGVMDLRYATGRMLEVPDPKVQREVGIRLSSASYPVTISWQLTNPTHGAVLRVDNEDISMNGSGTMRIAHAASAFALKLNAQSGMAKMAGTDVPKQFALRQNYPNPFNPSTSIRYELPVRSKIRLSVYNILGQEMYSLVDGMQDAGYQSATWNAAGAPSGVYFCRISATGVDDARQFMEVMKMVLVK